MLRKAIRFLVVCLCLLAGISFAHADDSEGDRVMVEVGPYVYHWVDNTDHNQWPRVIGAEYETASHWLAGATSFKNSYYQEAALLYVGKRWFIPPVSESLYVKAIGALVYGYKKPYANKLPINHDGYGLAFAPVLGYQFGRAHVQIEFLGTGAGGSHSRVRYLEVSGKDVSDWPTSTDFS